jgi:hypothetical protein
MHRGTLGSLCDNAKEPVMKSRNVLVTLPEEDMAGECCYALNMYGIPARYDMVEYDDGGDPEWDVWIKEVLPDDLRFIVDVFVQGFASACVIKGYRSLSFDEKSPLGIATKDRRGIRAIVA